ncbi:hypothetical protein [Rufibacter sp. LB8]|uniref:hypothetical protein n=1 Tax=Rufibacter sp. LB8 TaxID=2777781 RepID=UPI00178C5F85|nr:hypothetical protein [Rufibacter sp. LB8]
MANTIFHLLYILVYALMAGFASIVVSLVPTLIGYGTAIYFKKKLNLKIYSQKNMNFSFLFGFVLVFLMFILNIESLFSNYFYIILFAGPILIAFLAYYTSGSEEEKVRSVEHENLINSNLSVEEVKQLILGKWSFLSKTKVIFNKGDKVLVDTKRELDNILKIEFTDTDYVVYTKLGSTLNSPYTFISNDTLILHNPEEKEVLHKIMILTTIKLVTQISEEMYNDTRTLETNIFYKI